jgi:sulfur-oxidizing protein SoxY
MSSPTSPRSGTEPGRRALFGGLLTLALAPPAGATPEAMAEAIALFTGGATPELSAAITLDIPSLVENGNTVPVTIAVDSPMTEAAHVRAIALFNQRNPQPQVIEARLGPWSGAARISTRARLADSQRLTAVAALSDGRFLLAEAEVVVTLAACLEG